MLTDTEKRSCLLGLLKRIYWSRPDLQNTFDSWDSPGFLIWLNSHGVIEYPSIRSLVPPIPPEPLRVRVHGGEKPAAFLGAGGQIFSLIREACIGKVLDFGCGCGRVARYFLFKPDCKFYGSDIDTEAIEWCGRNLSGIFGTNSIDPPTRYQDGFFDLVFSISVFSHLNETNHRLWLNELKRITKPKGLVLLTIHGEHALNVIIKKEKRDGIPNPIYQAAKPKLESTGFSFVYADQIPSHVHREYYGSTFISHDYIRKNWGHVLECRTAALDDQDLIILSRDS